MSRHSNVRSLASRFLVIGFAAVAMSAMTGCPKHDSSSSTNAPAAGTSSSDASALSGTWQSQEIEGGHFTLDFKPDNKVVLTMTAPGQNEKPAEGLYSVDGNTVTINAGMFPFSLTRNGNNLIGNLAGTPVKFTKK